MADSSTHKTGHCRCGRVQFEVSAPPLITMACHCFGCQRMTGSAFSLSALYPCEALEITSGEPVIGALHGAARHYYCGYCMSAVYTNPHGMNKFVSVRATLMDDAEHFSPFIESHTDEMLPWVKTPAVHSFDKNPSPEEFPKLLAEYAQHSH